MLHSIICVKTHFKMSYNQIDNIPPCTLQEVNESPETLRYIWYPGAVYLVSGISVISGIWYIRYICYLVYPLYLVSRTRDLRARDIRTTKCFERDVRRPDHEEQDDKLWAWVRRTTQHELQKHFKNCFSGCESRSLVGWTSTTTRWTLTPVSSKLAAVSLWRKKGQHPKLFSLQITTQKTWWLARPSSSTTWSGSAVYSISSQSKTCRSSFTPSSFPQVIHVTTMAKCISKKKTHPLKYVSWSVPHEIFTACRKKYIDGAKW